MMISTKGRYALRVMIDLAEHLEDGYVSLREISKRQDVSMKYLEMIVGILNKGGLLKSLRGPFGGHCLARPADQINVYEVIRLTEGGIAPVACLESKTRCKRADSCRTLPMWRNLDALIAGYLSGISILDLAEGKITADRQPPACAAQE